VLATCLTEIPRDLPDFSRGPVRRASSTSASLNLSARVLVKMGALRCVTAKANDHREPSA
jgi:hypothetical protein